VKVADIISEKFIEALNRGTVPWQRPWRLARPYNFVTKNIYHGVNLFLLATTPYSDPRWATFNNLKSINARLKKNEKGMPIVFYKCIEDVDDKDEINKKFILRYSTVFNVEQCEEGTVPELEVEEKPIIANAEVDRFVDNTNIKIINQGDVACYSPSRDMILIPERKLFHNDDSYYSTLFHELIHATGHSSRLNRFKDDVGGSIFGSESYSKEELVAELGSSILRCEFDIETDQQFEQSAAYINSWVKAIKNESGLILHAARMGEAASNYLLESTKGENDGAIEN
jgi:antirestriction protein ArdC